MIDASIKYYFQDKLYIWKRRKNKITNEKLRITNEKKKENTISQNSVKLTGSKLQDLAWSLDVLDLKK